MGDFKGTNLNVTRDGKRLYSQHIKVRDAALGWPTEWFTMQELAAKVGEPPASVERQIRYLRQESFGGFTVDKRHVSGGTFEYRVL